MKWLGEREAAAAIMQRFGGDGREALEKLLKAGAAGEIEIWAVLHAHDGQPIGPATPISPAALAREYVGADDERWERWHDGVLRPTRWHGLKVRAPDLETWLRSIQDDGKVAQRHRKISSAFCDLVAAGMQPGDMTTQELARQVCRVLGEPEGTKGYDPQTIKRRWDDREETHFIKMN